MKHNSLWIPPYYQIQLLLLLVDMIIKWSIIKQEWAPMTSSMIRYLLLVVVVSTYQYLCPAVLPHHYLLSTTTTTTSSSRHSEKMKSKFSDVCRKYQSPKALFLLDHFALSPPFLLFFPQLLWWINQFHKKTSSCNSSVQSYRPPNVVAMATTSSWCIATSNLKSSPTFNEGNSSSNAISTPIKTTETTSCNHDISANLPLQLLYHP